MTDLPPSYPPQNPKPRPSADGATEIGRRQRMSKPDATIRMPQAKKQPEHPQPGDIPPRDQGVRRTPRRPQAEIRNDVPPPSFTPKGRVRAPQRPEERPAQAPSARTAPVPQRAERPRRKANWKRRILICLTLLLVALIAWPVYLYNYGQSKFTHIDALSGAANTPGRTVLFAGTDQRSEDGVNDGVEGQRSDSIMLVHVPDSGNPSLISLPRDTYVDIPGHGPAKLNAAYSIGGPKLLVATVESMTGLSVDNYVEVGMGGISNLVDAVGGVHLCLDYDVTQDLSGLEWTAGCHDADGPTALAFSRMRYSDPLGDLGRTARQRQVVSQIFSKITEPGVLLNPIAQRDVVGSAAEVLTIDEDSTPMDMASIALSLRKIMGPDGVVGTPPIADANYRPGGLGSTVLLDPNTIDQFWAKVKDGSISPADVAVPGL